MVSESSLCCRILHIANALSSLFDNQQVGYPNGDDLFYGAVICESMNLSSVDPPQRVKNERTIWPESLTLSTADRRIHANR
jgi:hypothetical protein